MPTKGPGDPIGNHYHMGAHHVVSRGPIDAMIDISMDEDKYLYKAKVDVPPEDPDYVPEILTSQILTINKPELFGGDEREGGVSGKLAVAFGEANQEPNTYLENTVDVFVSAYRGVVSLIMQKMYIGNHYFLKTISTRVRRINIDLEGLPQWEPNYAEPLPGEMNGIHIIREKLLDQRAGGRKLESQIDNDSFQAAAITCYNEGLGFSFQNIDDAEVFLKDLEAHLNCRIYEDLDGKFKIKLLRDDYNVDTIPDISSYISKVVSFEHTAPDKLYNAVEISFRNRSFRGKEDRVLVTSPALIARQQGRIRKKGITFKGVKSKTLARRFGQRELAAASVDLPEMVIETTRGTENLKPGDPFKWSYDDPAVTNLVCRVKTINKGSPTSNKITITAVKDVFSAASPAYFTDVESAWVDPVNDPSGIQHGFITETPYYLYALKFGDAEAQAIAIDTCFISCAGEAPTPDSSSAVISYDDGSGYLKGGTMYFCPTAVLVGNIAELTTSLTIELTKDWDLLVAAEFIQADEELMKIVSFTDTTLVVARGVMDTIPAPHAEGTKLYAWQTRNGYIKQSFFSGEIIDVKLRPTTPRGTLPLADAAISSIELNNRLTRPYPPGNVKINGVAFPTSVSGTITLSWAHRNRLTETSGLVDHTAGDIGPEPGTTYNIRLYSGATLLRSELGYAGNSYAVIPDDTDPYYNNIVDAGIELESVRDGLVSMQKYFLQFAYGP